MSAAHVGYLAFLIHDGVRSTLREGYLWEYQVNVPRRSHTIKYENTSCLLNTVRLMIFHGGFGRRDIASFRGASLTRLYKYLGFVNFLFQAVLSPDSRYFPAKEDYSP